jgi:hypothetical protein
MSLRIVLAGVALAVAAATLQSVSIILAVIVAGAAFLVGLVVLGVAKPSDIWVLKQEARQFAVRKAASRRL